MAMIEIKKSKFIAFIFNVKDKQAIEKYLKKIRLQYKDASHVCYAYIIENGRKAGKSDDKEPKGTASKPLFNLLKIKKLHNHLLIVVRYYGGKKLGASNLTRAYLQVAKLVT